MFAKDSLRYSFWRYAVYADIREASRTRMRKLTVSWS